jgi:hypothetical protein
MTAPPQPIGGSDYPGIEASLEPKESVDQNGAALGNNPIMVLGVIEIWLKRRTVRLVQCADVGMTVECGSPSCVRLLHKFWVGIKSKTALNSWWMEMAYTDFSRGVPSWKRSGFGYLWPEF